MGMVTADALSNALERETPWGWPGRARAQSWVADSSAIPSRLCQQIQPRFPAFMPLAMIANKGPRGRADGWGRRLGVFIGFAPAPPGL
jgi:hypothetical protein